MQHNTIQNCSQYHKTDEQVCEECSADSWMFIKQNQCVPVFIENCESYASLTECEKCEERFDLIDGKFCVLMDLNKHCLRAKENKCSLCEQNYLLRNG